MFIITAAVAFPWGLTGPFFFAQKFNDKVVKQCPLLHDSKVFHGNSDLVVSATGSTGTRRHYVYVDTLGALGPHAEYAQEA